MNILSKFNFWEGVFWILIAIWFFIDVFRSSKQKQWFHGLCGVAFLTFGVSDFVELRSGAWWEPWWLLIWKGGCILGFICLYIWYRKLKEQK